MKLGKQIKEQSRTGEIIWVHPKNRYALVEYKVLTPFGLKTLRECLKIVNGQIMY